MYFKIVVIPPNSEKSNGKIFSLKSHVCGRIVIGIIQWQFYFRKNPSNSNKIGSFYGKNQRCKKKQDVLHK